MCLKLDWSMLQLRRATARNWQTGQFESADYRISKRYPLCHWVVCVSVCVHPDVGCLSVGNGPRHTQFCTLLMAVHFFSSGSMTAASTRTGPYVVMMS